VQKIIAIPKSNTETAVLSRMACDATLRSCQQYESVRQTPRAAIRRHTAPHCTTSNPLHRQKANGHDLPLIRGASCSLQARFLILRYSLNQSKRSLQMWTKPAHRIGCLRALDRLPLASARPSRRPDNSCTTARSRWKNLTKPSTEKPASLLKHVEPTLPRPTLGPDLKYLLRRL